jgi:hypothetical protein
MASRPVPPKYLKAGEDYLQALRRLGLNPNFLGWGWEANKKQWHLVLVTSIVDAGGPLALNKLLFRAYNANATPKEISPFIVRVFSPEVITDPTFYFLGVKDLHVHKVDPKTNVKQGEGDRIENYEVDFLGLHLEMINSYQSAPPSKTRGYHDRRKDWVRFKSNVERLAA